MQPRAQPLPHVVHTSPARQPAPPHTHTAIPHTQRSRRLTHTRGDGRGGGRGSSCTVGHQGHVTRTASFPCVARSRSRATAHKHRDGWRGHQGTVHAATARQSAPARIEGGGANGCCCGRSHSAHTVPHPSTHPPPTACCGQRGSSPSGRRPTCRAPPCRIAPRASGLCPSP